MYRTLDIRAEPSKRRRRRRPQVFLFLQNFRKTASSKTMAEEERRKMMISPLQFLFLLYFFSFRGLWARERNKWKGRRDSWHFCQHYRRRWKRIPSNERKGAGEWREQLVPWENERRRRIRRFRQSECLSVETRDKRGHLKWKGEGRIPENHSGIKIIEITDERLLGVHATSSVGSGA